MNNDKNRQIFEKKLESIQEPSKLATRLEFIQKLETITSKHPFIYIPYFISDFISGESKMKLFEKYHFTSFSDLSKIIEVLQFKQYRYLKKNYKDAKIRNLKIPRWNEIYESLNDNCKYFEHELNQFCFERLLRAYIFVTMFDFQKNGIDHFGLAKICRSNIENFFIFHFVDEKLIRTFKNLSNQKLEENVLQILDDFLDKGIIKRKKSKPSFFVNPLTIDRIKSIITTVLRVENTGLRRGSIISRLVNIEPGLKEIPGLGVWETALHYLEEEKKVVAEQKFIFKTNDIIYLTENYEKIQQKLTSLNDSSLKFYGRKISPENFIHELLELEQGDFDDDDDQVTRLAGLVLAESVKLRAPHESIPEFDFSVNIKDYHFRPDQREAMTKSDFKINSEIIHFKVMIGKTLTLEKYEELKKKLPINDKCI